MRRRLTSCALFVALAASAAAAQQYTRVWLRVVPEGEEFAVHFPEPNYRIQRELPFGDTVTLKPASYEVTYDGALLSVLSFVKSKAGAPKTLAAFVKGFQNALAGDKDGARTDSGVGKAVKLDGHVGREFQLKVGDDTGAARVFETEKHFYIVLTYGGKESADIVEHFHKSFSLDRAATDRVVLREPSDDLPVSPKQPAPLWPVAGSTVSIGVMARDRDASASSSSARQPDSGGKSVVSGGVLNGKAIANTPPVYPPIAKAARAQGTVTVQVLVDEEGYVIAANAVSGHPLLQHASVLAARQTRFEPTMLIGQPVKVTGVITYNFVLQ